MSNIYINEPPTQGKVILKTTFGEIEIELWSKETPKACRNFVQLCLESYYNNNIFHRVVPNFIAQTGDATGTGTGGESIYGAPFESEHHSRLKFNKRGLVATAGEDDNNDSQFFITMDKADFLNGKHTIFGRVVGNTIFNVLKMSDLETTANDVPMDPPKILSTEVLYNPFNDIIPRKAAKVTTEKKIKKNAVKNNSLLSFGDEVEEESAAPKKKKAKSSHDLLNDPKLSKEVAVKVVISTDKPIVSSDEAQTESKLMQSRIKEKLSARNKEPPSKDAQEETELQKPKEQTQPKPNTQPTKKLSFKTDPKNSNDKVDKVATDYLKEQREKFKKRSASTNRQDEALKKVLSFTSRLQQPEPKKIKLDEKQDEEGWITHRLQFDTSHEKETHKASRDYEVTDP
ncbi:hypothetical protein AKO1_009842, partial [Acrasis kona]